jgi:bifunctional enzyme CysN/CysC
LNFSEARDLLRFVTAGSVDDGKSTLIGRLLYEGNGLYEDQLQSIRKASARKNIEFDPSLVTDGLHAEREQSITIDVGYRYFSTAKRKFIIADAPGHEQYTRNMVTAASTAQAAVLLIDARKGILEQTTRHAYILWLLGVRRIILVINKMDLVNFDQGVFEDVSRAFSAVTASLEGLETYFIPLSALNGDNLVERSVNTPWYHGPSLLELLETLPVDEQRNLTAFRFPIQNVIRPHQDFRGYSGRVVSGEVEPGQEVVALPSGQKTKIEQIFLYQQTLTRAVAPQSVLLSLADHIDLGRGDLLADAASLPMISRRLVADLIWMSETPSKARAPYLMKHTTQTLCCSIETLLHRFDITTFQKNAADRLELNEIGTVELHTHKPMIFDPYTKNREMGSFILIDPMTNSTAAAGIISRELRSAQRDSLPAISSHLHSARPERGVTVWFTGLSGAGKSTICNYVYTDLLARGFQVEVLDGDVVRKHLSSDLGFGKKDRDENIRRIGFVAELLTQHGVITLVSAISPYRAIREEVRGRIGNFIEVYVNAPLNVCEQRDPKGLYKKARAGEIVGFTGIDDPYDPPTQPEVECKTGQESIKQCGEKVISAVLQFFSAQDALPEQRPRADNPACASA